MPNVPQRAPVSASLGLAAAPRTREEQARLQALVWEHLDRAARIIRTLGAPVDELEDLIQQAFSITAARLPDIAAGKERAFLVETAVRLTLDARRSRARSWAREAAAADLSQIAAAQPSPEELSDQRQALRLLDRALSEVDEELRTVLVLYEVEEMTMAEIAILLQIPAGTVASRLRRAREDFMARVHRLQIAEERRRTGGQP
jgi:RNA polymerase sigma-70 factor (ECF subfamily)